jgi:hypothetical protein
LEILKEVAPQVARVAIFFNPNTIPYAAFVRSVEAAAPSFAVQAVPTPVHSPPETLQSRHLLKTRTAGS